MLQEFPTYLEVHHQLSLDITDPNESVYICCLPTKHEMTPDLMFLRLFPEANQNWQILKKNRITNAKCPRFAMSIMTVFLLLLFAFHPLRHIWF